MSALPDSTYIERWECQEHGTQYMSSDLEISPCSACPAGERGDKIIGRIFVALDALRSDEGLRAAEEAWRSVDMRTDLRAAITAAAGVAVSREQRPMCSCGGEDSDGRGDVLACPVHGIGPQPFLPTTDEQAAAMVEQARGQIPPVEED